MLLIVSVILISIIVSWPPCLYENDLIVVMYYDLKSGLGKNETGLDQFHYPEYLYFTVLSLRARIRKAAVLSEQFKTLTVTIYFTAYGHVF